MNLVLVPEVMLHSSLHALQIHSWHERLIREKSKANTFAGAEPEFPTDKPLAHLIFAISLNETASP